MIPASAKRQLKTPDMLSRRELLLAAASLVLLPRAGLAASKLQNSIGWSDYRSLMNALAEANAGGSIDLQRITEHGLRYLKQLDITAADFKQAVDDSFETGNHFWFWQRMIKQKNLNGGILTIEADQMVQLHDHPGATGMVRIISGEAEVWLFDEMHDETAGDISLGVSKEQPQTVRLKQVSRRILSVGDTAVLTPSKGNIHALRSVSNECSMLDFFIPPYERSQRSWFEPLAQNWFDKKNILCHKISQHAYTEA